MAKPGRQKQKSRKRQKYEAEDASSLQHLCNLQKNTNDRNAKESQENICGFALPEGVGDDLPGQEAVQREPRLGAENVPRVLLVHVELLGLGELLEAGALEALIDYIIIHM